MPKIKLKCCPFCGSDNLKLVVKRGKSGYNYTDVADTYYVECLECYSRGGAVLENVKSSERTITADELKKQAVESWNRRTKDETD